MKKYLDFKTNKAAVTFLKRIGEEQLTELNIEPVVFGCWYFFDDAQSNFEMRIRNLLARIEIESFIIYNED